MLQVIASSAVVALPTGQLSDPDLACDARDIDAGEAVYRLLMRGCRHDSADGFDIHVVACILALAFWESIDEQRPLSATTGLEPAELRRLVAAVFPDAVYFFPEITEHPVERSADEECLRDLLATCATHQSAWQRMLAAMIARRAQRADHLWQDLGLRDRGELSRLMQRHFRPLAARNSSDMKWKKFLYRMICRDAGYSLCTAPSCSECADFEVCFGDETGESRLARVRRDGELGTAPAMGS